MNRLGWSVLSPALVEKTKMKNTRTNGKNGRNGNAPVRPVHRITRGSIECAIWERQGRAGRFFQTSLSRSYQTKDGTFGSSPNVGHGDLPDALYALVAAALWMEAQRAPRVKDESSDLSHEGTEADVDYDAEVAEYEQF